MRDLAVAFGVSLRETPREKGATLRLGQGVWVASQLGARFAPALHPRRKRVQAHMRANIPTAAGRRRAGNKRLSGGDSSRGMTALRAVRGQDALAPGTTPNEGRSEGVPPSNPCWNRWLGVCFMRANTLALGVLTGKFQSYDVWCATTCTLGERHDASHQHHCPG